MPPSPERDSPLHQSAEWSWIEFVIDRLQASLDRATVGMEFDDGRRSAACARLARLLADLDRPLSEDERNSA